MLIKSVHYSELGPVKWIAPFHEKQRTQKEMFAAEGGLIYACLQPETVHSILSLCYPL
jgi:hypothetical protein